jgi:hypothetical protein
MVKKLKNDPLAKIKAENAKPGDTPLSKAKKANQNKDVLKEHYETLSNGTRVKNKRMADGRIIREVIKETEKQNKQNKLNAMKDLANK